MRNNDKTREEYDEEVILEDNSQYDDNEEEYNLLSTVEMQMLDALVDHVVKLAMTSPVDKMHIAQFWRYLSSKLYKARYNFVQGKVEMENQKTDLEHKLTELDSTSDEYMSVLRRIGDVVTTRRILKDMSEYLQVACSNIKTVGNFIGGMNKRQYTPKSKKYSEETTSSKSNETHVKTVSTEQQRVPSHIFYNQRRQ